MLGAMICVVRSQGKRSETRQKEKGSLASSHCAAHRVTVAIFHSLCGGGGTKPTSSPLTANRGGLHYGLPLPCHRSQLYTIRSFELADLSMRGALGGETSAMLGIIVIIIFSPTSSLLYNQMVSVGWQVGRTVDVGYGAMENTIGGKHSCEWSTAPTVKGPRRELKAFIESFRDQLFGATAG